MKQKTPKVKDTNSIVKKSKFPPNMILVNGKPVHPNYFKQMHKFKKEHHIEQFEKAMNENLAFSTIMTANRTFIAILSSPIWMIGFISGLLSLGFSHGRKFGKEIMEYVK